MKRSPFLIKLEEVLRSSKIVSGGFMGDDPRRVEDIIDADTSRLAQLGHTKGELADAMWAITEKAIPALGNWVDLGHGKTAKVDEAKGMLVSPWPEPGRFPKRVTFYKDQQTGRELHWSDLGIHLIRQHGFFEGKGSHYRLEPDVLVSALFEKD